MTATGAGLLELLAAGAHTRSSVRFMHDLDAPAEPLPALWEGGRRTAGWLARRVGPSPVVATVLEASRSSLAAMLGTWLVGGRLVSLPAQARGQSIESYRGLVVDALRLAEVDLLAVIDPTDPAWAEVPVVVAPVDAMGDADPIGEPLEGGDLVQFSSGTTGRAKGIVLTLDAVAANVAGILDRLDLDGPGTSCSWLPLSHDMGLVGMCLVPWAAFGPRWQQAGEMALIPTAVFSRNPSIWLRACSTVRATVTTAPTFAYELAARRLHPDRPLDLSSLRACIVGAEPVSASALDRFAKAAEPSGLDPTSLCPAYGLAESTLAVAMVAPDEMWRPVPAEEGGSPLVSCGRPIATTEVRAGPGGHLLVRGRSRFDGYLGQPPLAAGEWHDTGDLGAVVAGEVVVRGRAGDLLFVGGLKVDAGRVEEIARSAAPSVVRDAAAVQRGSADYVVVVERRRGATARSGSEAAAAAIRHEVLRALGRGPAEVLVVAAGTLPRTPSGKVQRSHVGEQIMSAELPVDARVVFRVPDQPPKTEA